MLHLQVHKNDRYIIFQEAEEEEEKEEAGETKEEEVEEDHEKIASFATVSFEPPVGADIYGEVSDFTNCIGPSLKKCLFADTQWTHSKCHLPPKKLWPFWQFLAHLSRSDKVSFCDRSSSVHSPSVR